MPAERTEYHVAFWTKDPPKGAPAIPPGHLLAVKVTLEYDLLPPEHGPLAEAYNVALADHHAYPALARYVKSNPPG